jgi:hypothetical protein
LENKALQKDLAENAKNDLKNISWDLTAQRVMQGYSRFTNDDFRLTNKESEVVNRKS